jgi:uncharacterized protein YdhG (YjbR/CyaY superfamily)
MTDRARDETSTASARIDAILDALPADQRAALQSLRETIATAAPEAEEAISYAAPAFRYSGRPLVAYSAAKAHCSFYPMSPAVQDAYRDELSGFDMAKGTIRFVPENPIPAALVASIVRARMAEIDTGRA